MKRRIYDFTPLTAAVTLLAYTILLAFTGVAFLTNGYPPFPGILFLLLSASLLAVLWYYVLMAPVISSEGIRHGKKSISKENIRYNIFYNNRFREIQIELSDKTIHYTQLPETEIQKKCIYVQATRSNLRKLSSYLACEIVIPEEATRKGRRKHK